MRRRRKEEEEEDVKDEQRLREVRLREVRLREAAEIAEIAEVGVAERVLESGGVDSGRRGHQAGEEHRRDVDVAVVAYATQGKYM